MYQIPKEYKEDQSLVMGLIATVFLTAIEDDKDVDAVVDVLLDMAGSVKQDIDALCELLITHYEPEVVPYQELYDSVENRIRKLAGMEGVKPIKQGEIEAGVDYPVTGKTAEFLKAIIDFQFRYRSKLRIMECVDLFTENVIGGVMKHTIEDDVALNKEDLTYHKMTKEELFMSMSMM